MPQFDDPPSDPKGFYKWFFSLVKEQLKMPRCTSCNKFVAIDSETSPEVEDLEISQGEISASVRIANCCGECGEELSEFTFNIEDVEVSHQEHPNDLAVVEGLSYRSEKTINGRKNYGFSFTAVVTCSQCDFKEEIILDDYIPASEMEEM